MATTPKIAANQAYASFAATFFRLRRYFCHMIRMKLLFAALAVFSCFQVFAQKPDSLHTNAEDTLLIIPTLSKSVDASKLDTTSMVDTTLAKTKKDGFVHRTFFKNYPNPRMAALFSFALPGAGQAYNKKWWKIPIVWGALGGIAYGTFSTQKTYHNLRDAYKTIVNGGVPESPYDGFDAPRLRSYRDTFRGYTEKWYLALGVTYLLAVTDAFVDAHLSRFDVSDDLSLRLKPSLETTAGVPVFGLGISLSLSKSNLAHPLTFSRPYP